MYCISNVQTKDIYTSEKQTHQTDCVVILAIEAFGNFELLIIHSPCLELRFLSLNDEFSSLPVGFSLDITKRERKTTFIK